MTLEELKCLLNPGFQCNFLSLRSKGLLTFSVGKLSHQRTKFQKVFSYQKDADGLMVE